MELLVRKKSKSSQDKELIHHRRPLEKAFHTENGSAKPIPAKQTTGTGTGADSTQYEPLWSRNCINMQYNNNIQPVNVGSNEYGFQDHSIRIYQWKDRVKSQSNSTILDGSHHQTIMSK